MAQEFRQKLIQAAIAEMENALDDPGEDDPPQHVQEKAISIDMEDDGAVGVQMVFGEMPAWVTTDHQTEVTSSEISGTITLKTNPHTMRLRITSSATATISFQHQETGEWEEQQVTPEQQETLNRYVTQAAFQVTGMANGELLHYNAAENRAAIDGGELLDELETRVEEAALLAEEMANRMEKTDVDEDDPDYLMAIALTASLRANSLNLEVLADRLEAIE